MFETAGEAPLEVGVPLREVGIRPQSVAKVKLVVVALTVSEQAAVRVYRRTSTESARSGANAASATEPWKIAKFDQA